MGRLERPYRHQFAPSLFKQGQSDIDKGLFNSNPIGKRTYSTIKNKQFLGKGSLVFFVFFFRKYFSATVKANGSRRVARKDEEALSCGPPPCGCETSVVAAARSGGGDGYWMRERPDSSSSFLFPPGGWDEKPREWGVKKSLYTFSLPFNVLCCCCCWRDTLKKGKTYTSREGKYFAGTTTSQEKTEGEGEERKENPFRGVTFSLAKKGCGVQNSSGCKEWIALILAPSGIKRLNYWNPAKEALEVHYACTMYIYKAWSREMRSDGETVRTGSQSSE